MQSAYTDQSDRAVFTIPGVGAFVLTATNSSAPIAVFDDFPGAPAPQFTTKVLSPNGACAFRVMPAGPGMGGGPAALAAPSLAASAKHREKDLATHLQEVCSREAPVAPAVPTSWTTSPAAVAPVLPQILPWTPLKASTGDVTTAVGFTHMAVLRRWARIGANVTTDRERLSPVSSLDAYTAFWSAGVASRAPLFVAGSFRQIRASLTDWAVASESLLHELEDPGASGLAPWADVVLDDASAIPALRRGLPTLVAFLHVVRRRVVDAAPRPERRAHLRAAIAHGLGGLVQLATLGRANPMDFPTAVGTVHGHLTATDSPHADMWAAPSGRTEPVFGTIDDFSESVVARAPKRARAPDGSKGKRGGAGAGGGGRGGR